MDVRVTQTAQAPPLAALCVCPDCFSPIVEDGGQFACTQCERRFAVHNGVLHLLPTYDSDVRLRYAAEYEAIAQSDLDKPFEYDRDKRHGALLDFIGDVRGQRVLDVGSSYGGYLTALDAGMRVATDIAATCLEAIPEETGIVRVRADAEHLPFQVGTFDVVIVSDVLEHLIEPQRLVDRLHQMSTPQTRIIVHVPWEEDISGYRDSGWEFAHLRSFNDYSFATLFANFRVVRERATHPDLRHPFVFRLRRRVPLSVYNVLTWWYFHRGYAAKEYERRATWIAELPRRERWLLGLYRPLFRSFELRPLARRAVPEQGYAVPLPASIERALSFVRACRADAT
jgi:SAM-dependent methyltransferase